MKLSKEMFGREFSPNQNNPFGLHTGQMRAGSFIHNGGWYNANGEKLGWGDLSIKDVKEIKNNLETKQVFIVLGEHESFWNFVTYNPGVIGAMCETAPDASAPGPGYVYKHMRYAITKDAVWNVRNLDLKKEPWEEDGLWFYPASRLKAVEKVQNIINGY